MSKRNSSSSSSTASSSTTLNQDNSNLPYVLARHDSHDCYFDIKVTRCELVTVNSKEAYQLHFKLDFARPFDPSKRIRSAAVDIQVTSNSRDPNRPGPAIVGIDPEASLVYMADHEVSSGQNVGVNVGAPGPAAGAISANVGLTWGDKTTFKGSRLFHGFLPSPRHAQWKMYEEPKSKSGLPPSVRLMVIVKSARSFYVSANVLVQRRSAFGWVRNISAPATTVSARGYKVQRRLVRAARESALNEVSDKITELLREGEGKMQTLQGIVDKEFPNLNLSAVYGHHIALLKLKSMNGLFDRKQIEVPFLQDGTNKLLLGRQSGEARARRADGNFNTKSVSLRHAEVWADKETGQVYIRDLSSRGGTFVNGQRLGSGEARELHEHDQLQLGTDIQGDDSKSKKHVRVMAKVNFAGLALPNTREVEARKEAARKDVNSKFDVWTMMAVGEKEVDMLNGLADVVGHRLEALEILTYGSNSPFIDEGESEQGDPEEDEEGHGGGHGSFRITDAAPPTGGSRRRSTMRDRTYDGDHSLRPDEDRGPTYVHYGSRASARKGSRNTCSARRLIPKIQTGEEALASHRTVGRDWKEVKL
ncbi:hypothetical protein EDD36DRAFT_420502 [Exophiala viscosa]|uniref:FHA domain-containing protein n=1 Tax=Exophiala viscosa TaxID=2486360 RepID=A0AAN6DUE5_9EURO|nr:hypothetical protein EDD36DRAFT_420502 [Exophiala viscosa]